MTHRPSVLSSAAIVLLMAGFRPASTLAQPLDQLRIVAPAAPGGGWDQTARVMQAALQRSGLVRIAPVENVPGAAGTIGLARFIGAERGRGDVVMISGLIMLSAIVTHASPVTLREVTPIARLTGEYEVIVVPAASSWRSLQDLLRVFKERPESVSWGGGSAGGSDQMLAGLVADAVGVPPRRVNYIAFSGGGEAMSAILGGQVSAGVSGFAEFAPQIDAGTVRVLGISSGERLPGLEAPTLREQGVDVVFENWRSVVAPPGMGLGDRQALERAIEAVVRSAEWREALQRYRWIDRYLAGEAFARYVETEERRVADVLSKLGMASGEPASSAVGAYPVIVLTGLLVCGGWALLETFGSARAESRRRRREWRPAALIAAGIVVDVSLMDAAGFVVASAALFWLTARAFDRRHPLRDLLFAIGVSTVAYLLFVHVLSLTLPAGPFGRWL